MASEINLDAVLDSLTDGQHSRDTEMLLPSVSAHIPSEISSLMQAACVDLGLNPPLAATLGNKRVFEGYSGLPEHLVALMTQANNKYVMGNSHNALGILHSVIQQRPHTIQAWTTLSVIHGELGNNLKSLQCGMMAAHLNPKDGELWQRLAVQSRNLELTEQSIYCYQKVTKADSLNVDALWQQGVMYRDTQKFELSIAAFEAILLIIPNTMAVIKELAKLYLDTEDIPRAIDLFEQAIEADVIDPLNEKNIVIFNELDDLDDPDGDIVGHVSMGQPMKKLVRMGFEELNMLAELLILAFEYEKVIYTIQTGIGRLLGKTFINEDFDEISKSFAFPMSLRVKLGIARMMLDDPENSLIHFNFLYQENAVEYAELYLDVGEAYISKGQFTAALKVLSYLTLSSSTNVPVVWKQIAFCHAQLGQLDNAIAYLSKAIEVDTNDEKTLILMIEMLEEMGSTVQAEELWKRHRQILGTKLPEVSMINTQIFKDHASVQNTSSKILLFKANDIKTKAAASSTKPKLDSKIKEQALETSRLECIQNFKKLKALEDMLHVPAKRNEFLRLARKIMRRFDSKSGEPIISKQGPIVGLIPATEIIPNISMDDWYHVFIQFALNATRAGNEEEAQIALNRIVIAKQLEEDFSKFCLIISGSTFHFLSPANQKFLHRHLKLAEAEYRRKTLMLEPLFHLLVACGHIYMSSRYISLALRYYLKAFKLKQDDPCLCLSTGIAHLQRGMQARSENRHEHIMRGFSFIYRYANITGENPETWYNLARAYHQIGLYNLAIPKYEKCIEARASRYKESAYNLGLIYVSIGSNALAQEVYKMM